ncbi:cysteine-rich CWC family protein [Sporosarcina ureae]|uniref:cysteine-rich CWC family protein n=1 Tax=Sporosarcina ureae TaxID=1571 RepID=UPI0009F43799|nr:cysteine-rich CWC family protein [Sporosarcina ureae]
MKNECPICQGNNLCGSSVESDEHCWCTKKIFTEEVFRQIPEEQLHKQCICEACLNRIARIEKASKRSMNH